MKTLQIKSHNMFTEVTHHLLNTELKWMDVQVCLRWSALFCVSEMKQNHKSEGC